MTQTRLYSLFEKVNGKWVRQSGLALHKASAVRVFQNALLNGFFAGREVSLRVVKPSLTGCDPWGNANTAQGATVEL